VQERSRAKRIKYARSLGLHLVFGALAVLPTAFVVWSCGTMPAMSDAMPAADGAVDTHDEEIQSCPDCYETAAQIAILQDEAMRCDIDAGQPHCQDVTLLSMYPLGEPGCCGLIVDDRDSAPALAVSNAVARLFYLGPCAISCGCTLECRAAPCPDGGQAACPTKSFCRPDGRCQQWWTP